jgi:hypothetical protein
VSVPKEASELTGESAQARPKSSRLPRSIWFLLVLTLALVFVSLSMYLGPYKSDSMPQEKSIGKPRTQMTRDTLARRHRTEKP